MLRKVLLRYLITGVSVAATAYVIPGISYSGGVFDLLKIVTGFFLANLLLKPILKILAMPIEIATLGMFGLVINAFILWFVTYWVPEFKISSFWFSGLGGNGFIVAPVEIPVWLTAVFASLMIGFISTFLYWLVK